jgi:uncharacterized protein YbaR (Trm112 family)
MFIELVDSLRCLVTHEETWLVAAVMRMDGRHIVEGTLGCPVCRREYPIRDGVAWFSDRRPATRRSSLTMSSGPGDEALVTRAAALLGLSDPGGIVVLGGSWARFADGATELGAAHVVVLDAPASDARPQEVSSIVVDDRLPFAPGTLRAVALGREVSTPTLLASAAEALRSRGRLIAPADASVPDTIDVLARDAADWVGERGVVASPPVALRSARR